MRNIGWANVGRFGVRGRFRLLLLLLCAAVAASCSPAQPEPAATTRANVAALAKDLVLPQSQFPLPGYEVVTDVPTGDPGQGWQRDFKNPSATSDYTLVSTTAWVLAGDPKAYLNAESCTYTSTESAVRPTSRLSVDVPAVGDGANGCKFGFANGYRLFTYRLITRNVGVFLQAGARAPVSDAAALEFLASLARQHVAIVDQVVLVASASKHVTPQPTLAQTSQATANPTGPTPAPIPPYVEMKGEVPPIVTVWYDSPEGGVIAVPAIRGWVSLVATAAGTPEKVQALLTTQGWTVVEADTALGLYTIGAPAGSEGAAIARLRQEAWSVAASPLFFAGSAQSPNSGAIAVDYPYSEGLQGSTCDIYHGNLTAALMYIAGNNVGIKNAQLGFIDQVRVGLQASSQDLSPLTSTYFGIGRKLDEAMRGGGVVNVSLGARNEIGDTKLSPEAYAQSEAVFLAHIFRVAEAGPDVPVIVSAGNGDALKRGVDLTAYVAGLRKQFPKAAARVRIVYALTSDGARTSWTNYVSPGSIMGDEAAKSFIGAPGEKVAIDLAKVPGLPPSLIRDTVYCDGTSFGAPIVAGLMGLMRGAAQDKTSAALWKGFDSITQGKVPPHWRTALTIPLLNEARGIRVKTIAISPGAMTVQQGRNGLFGMTATDTAGNELKDFASAGYTWFSSNPAIAKVDSSGFVNGIAPGTATISASFAGATVQATVTVIAAVPTPTPTPAKVRTGGTMASPTCTWTPQPNDPRMVGTWTYSVSGTVTGNIGDVMNFARKLDGQGNSLSPQTITSGWTTPQGFGPGGDARARAAGDPETAAWSIRGSQYGANATSFEIVLQVNGGGVASTMCRR